MKIITKEPSGFDGFVKMAGAAAPEMTDEEIVEAKGHIPVDLYRIASGAKEIHVHSASKMTLRGRDRTRKGPIQLKLDILNFRE